MAETTPTPSPSTPPAPPTPTPAPVPADEFASADILEGVTGMDALDAPEQTDTPETAESPEPTETPVEEAPAENSETTPAAPETPAEVPPNEPEKPVEGPKPAAEPAQPDPQEAQRQQQAMADFAQWEKDFADAEAKFAKDGDFDPIDHGPAAIKTLMAGLKYAREAIQHLSREIIQQRSQTAEQQFWTDFGKQNPAVGPDKGRQWYEEAYREAAKEYRDASAVRAVATERWKQRVEAAKKPAAPPAPKAPTKPTPTVTQGGASIAPKTATRTPKPPVDDDPEAEFIRKTGGRIKDFLE